MSTPMDRMLERLITTDLDQRSAQKQQDLRQATLEKRTNLDPNFSVYDPDRYKVIDSDTVWDRETDESIRFHAGEGRMADAFETDIGRYDRDPKRAQRHREGYARLYGRDVDDISNEDLVNAGLAQKQSMMASLEGLRGKGMGFTRTGKDHYGRTLAQFDDNAVLDPILGPEGNAGYFSKYNHAQLLEDEQSGRIGQLDAPERSYTRALTGDAATSLLVGTQRMASGLAQGFLNPFIKAATGGKGIDAVDNFFDHLNKGADISNEIFSSEGKLAREKFDKKESAMLAPLYDIRKEAYKKANKDAPEWRASLSAITDEATDRIEYLIEEPGRILDASLESLPYMLGVGAVGKKASEKAFQRLRGEFKSRLKKSKVAPRGTGGRFISKDKALAEYTASPAFAKALKSTQRRTGIGTVAITEGLTNASDVYNSVRSMTPEEASQSDSYNALIDKGHTHQEAVNSLAFDAFDQTLAVTMLVAGIASGVTGAAGLETRMFTRLGRGTKGIDPENLLGKIGTRTGRTTGSFTGPAFREAVEETTQSGGGELISQMAAFEATGREVGPGVGAAAGEGGLVGLVSGGVMGGSSNLTKDVLDVVGAGAKKLGTKNTKLDEADKTTDISTDTKATVVQKKIREAKQAGESAEGFFLESTGQVEGQEDTPISPIAVNASYSAVLKDPSIPAARKIELGKVYDATMTKLGVEATAQAKELLENSTPEEIQNDKASLAKIRLATKLGTLTKADIDPSLHAFFSATTDTETALEEAEKVMAESSKAEAAATGKPEAQVYEEKMGHSVGELGPGLNAHAEHIGEAIENGDERGYAEADASLGGFIGSQVKKLAAYREMVERIHHNGENEAEVVKEINARPNKPLVPYKYIAPNAKAAASTGLLTGTSELADRIEKELGAMNKVRAALATEAKVFNKGSTGITTAANTAIKEATDAIVTPEVTPTESENPNPTAAEASPSQDGGGEAASKPTVEDDLNPPPPTDADFNPIDDDYQGDPRGNEDFTAEEGAGSQGSEATAATEATDEGGKTEQKEEDAVLDETENVVDEEVEEVVNEDVIDPDEVEEVENEDVIDPLEEIAKEKHRKKVQHIKTLIEKKFAKYAHIINFGTVSPRETAVAEHAMYNRTAKKVSVFLDTMAASNWDDNMVEWIIWHELFHAGIHSAYSAAKIEVIKRAAGNPAIIALARGIAESRKEDYTPAVHVEEALVELATGHKQKNLQQLKDFYNVELPTTLTGEIGKIVRDYLKVVRDLIQNFNNTPRRALTNGEILVVLQTMQESVMALGQETELNEGAETSSEAADEQFTPTSTPEVREVPETDEKQEDKPVNKNADGKIIPDPEDLETLRLSVYELRQLLSLKGTEGITDSSQIELSSDKLTTKFRNLVMNKMSVQEAAREILSDLAYVFDESIFEPPSEVTNNETLDRLFAALDEIDSKEGADSTTMANLEYAADFLSDGMVKYLGLLVGKITLPWEEWTQAELDETRDKIEARFKKMGLPTKVTQAFRTKSQKTKNLLAAVPNVVTAMFDGRTRAKLASKMGASARERQALNGVFKFMNNFIQEFDKMHLGLLNEAKNNSVWGNTPFGRTNIDDEKLAILNPLREYVIQFFYDQDTGKLDENITGIMGLEVGNWLATSGGSTLNNLEDVINDLIGREHGTKINPGDQEIFGNGTLMANAAGSIGQRVVSQANLQFTGNNIDPMMLDALHTSIGLMALSTVSKMDLVQINSVTNAVRKKLGNTHLEDASKETLAEEMNLLHITPKGQENEDKFSESEANEALRQSFTGAKRILESVFSTADYANGPTLVPVEETANKVSRGNTLIPKFLRNMFQKNQQYVWRVNQSAVETLDMFEEETLLGILGNRDPNKQHKKLREGISSTNAGNRRSLNQLNAWRKENGTNKFYFTYKMIRSGRLYIDSSSLNPQSDKLHRFMLQMDAWKVDVPIDRRKNKKLQNNLLVAIGLGLDIDSSKLTRQETVDQTKALLNDDATVLKVIALLKAGPTDESGKFTQEESALIASVLSKGDEAHGLAALKAWVDIEKARDAGQETVTIALPMETDGKTNGFASGLMQTPPLDDTGYAMVKQLLRATGIYFEGDDYLNYPAYARDGRKDNYQEVASETLSVADEMRAGNIIPLDKPGNKFRAEKLAKIQESQPSVAQIIMAQFMTIDRNFAKDPLMVVAYGAGMASTRRAITKKSVESFYEALGSAQTVEEAVAVMQRFDQVILGYRRQTYNAKNSAAKWTAQINKAGLVKFRTEWEMPSKANNHPDPAQRVYNQEQQFMDAHDAVFGHSLQRALENKLGPIQAVREKLNQATYLANGIFTRNFKRAIEQQERIYRRPLSDRERKIVLNQMIKQGLVPLIKTPLSKSHLDALMTTSDGRVIVGTNQDDPRKGRAYFNDQQQIKNNTSRVVGGKVVTVPAEAQASITSALTAYEPNMEVGVAALVKMIHSSDGAVNGTVMNEHQILNVHDAQIGNFNAIDGIAEFANKTFYETHRDWNLGEETFDSLVRLLPLIEDTDQRLSANDKIAIDEEFLSYLITYAGVDEETPKSEARTERQKWFKQFREQINDTNKARELLFGDIISVNQFAKEGTEYPIPSDDPRSPNSNRAEIIEEAETVEEVLSIIREDSENVWVVKKDDMIRELSMAKSRKSDLNAIIKDWLAPKGIGHAPAAGDLLDVVFAVFGEDFKNKAQEQYLQDLLAVLRPALTQVDAKTKKERPVFVRLGSENRFGRETSHAYHKESGILYINENAENVVEAILAGVIEAATVKNLENIQAEDPKKFRDIYQEAKKWHETEGNTAKPGFPSWTVAQEMWAARKDKVKYISRYLTGTGAMQHINDDGTRAFDFNTRMKQTVESLAKALSDNNGKNVFYSSPDNLTQSIFDGAEAHGLNAQSMLEVFQQIRTLESTPVSPATQKIFDQLIDTFIIPGLGTIDDIVLRMATNKDGSRNTGMWINDPAQSAIFLEATSQAYYNSPHEMSLQEVALHEILHAIVGAAVGYTYVDQFGNEQKIAGEASLRSAVDKLYNQTENYLEKEHGPGMGWKAFLPQGPTTHSDLDIKLAKQQFSHIFRSGNAQLHEFMAFGMTNPRFMEILGEVNTAPEGAVFEKGLITSFFNILDRIKAWLQETVLRQDRGTADKALQLLAQKIVHVNANTRHLAQQAADEGWLTKRLDSLNDLALQKLAQLVTGRLQDWANNQSLPGRELDEALKDQKMIKKLMKAAKSATASTMREDAMKGFRETFESALTGIDKGHWLYQMLTEVLPWADRNRSWIDILRKSERLVDMVRQQKFEHTRSALLSYFDPAVKFTRQTRENISRVILSTDLAALWSGPNAMTSTQLLNVMSSQALIAQYIEQLWTELEGKVSPELYRLFVHHGHGMANMMVDGHPSADQARNTYVLVNQFMVSDNDKVQIDDISDVQDILERVISLRALQKMPQAAVNEVVQIMQHEMSRGVKTNGFNGLLGTADAFKDLSLTRLFDGDESAMVKGYTSDINDAEVELKSVAVGMDAEMKAQGFTFVKDLKRAAMDDGPNMALWKKKKGIVNYAKSIMSLTGKHKQGTGMYDSMFATAPADENSTLTAARVHNKLRGMRQATYESSEAIMNGNPIPGGVNLVPLYNQDGEMVDFRYMMSYDEKKEHLKKREMFDEVLPRMMASIEDKTNTQVINHEAVDLLYEEYMKERKNPTGDVRFVMIGPDVPSDEGKELWNLLPKETKLYATQKFGGEVLYIRDDVVNMVLGFRKIAWSNNKFLGPGAPILDPIEKIWLEVMQWVRFRIAVLTPQVVIGNMVSNAVLLMSRGIPPNYILREARRAIVAMRKYQRDLRTRNELENTVAVLERDGQFAARERQELIRVNQALATNVVSDMVEEGMFTSIVEEFGMDEDSTRRQLTSKLLDKFGGITGSNTAVKVVQEAWMVPGSETAQAALMATQYGDFVGRFIQYKWQTEVKGVEKREAIHDALSTFIFYNIPQNRILQFLNDNGLLMFTKFFFRIQHVIARVFKENPVQAALTIVGQDFVSTALGSRTAEENIVNYAFLQNLTRKFQVTPWEHVTNGDMLVPTFLKWIPDVFFGE